MSSAFWILLLRLIYIQNENKVEGSSASDLLTFDYYFLPPIFSTEEKLSIAWNLSLKSEKRNFFTRTSSLDISAIGLMNYLWNTEKRKGKLP